MTLYYAVEKCNIIIFQYDITYYQLSIFSRNILCYAKQLFENLSISRCKYLYKVKTVSAQSDVRTIDYIELPILEILRYTAVIVPANYYLCRRYFEGCLKLLLFRFINFNLYRYCI